LIIPIITVRDKNQPPWFNSDIRHHIKCIHTLRCKHKRRPTEYNLTNLEYSQQQLQSKISNAKSIYEHNLVSEFANNYNSKIYKYIKEFTKSASIHSTMVHDSHPIICDNDKANIFLFLPRLQTMIFSLMIILHLSPK